jgi:hypothetical protein
VTVGVVARYRIVPERSRVWIEARSSVHPIHSSTDGLEGYIDLEPGVDGTVGPGDEPRGQLSLRVDRLSSGNRLEDRELHRRIEARRFPTIGGVLVGMRPAGADGRYRVSGDITFRGVARRAEDEMVIEVVDDHTITLAGQSTFDIRDYGMAPPRILMLRVEPTVRVRVAIIATEER